MEVIILAGGFGTRLSSVVKDVPKPMAPIGDKPFLALLLDRFIRQGATHFVLAVCHKKEQIMDYFGDSYGGVPVDYSIEKTPLGTGGAIRQALKLCCQEWVTVVNGDSYFQVDLLDFQQIALDLGAPVCIAAKKMYDFSRYGQMIISDTGHVTAFLEKQPCAEGYINGGVYNVERTALEQYPEVFSMEEDCFPVLVKNRQVTAAVCDGYFIDIGIPEDYEKAQTYFGCDEK